MVGVWCVLCPLEQGPLKLDGDLGDGVGWQLNEHLQEVGLLPVLGRLIVDVTWLEARGTWTLFLKSDYLCLLPLCLGINWKSRQEYASGFSEKGEHVSCILGYR